MYFLSLSPFRSHHIILSALKTTNLCYESTAKAKWSGELIGKPYKNINVVHVVWFAVSYYHHVIVNCRCRVDSLVTSTGSSYKTIMINDKNTARPLQDAVKVYHDFFVDCLNWLKIVSATYKSRECSTEQILYFMWPCYFRYRD